MTKRIMLIERDGFCIPNNTKVLSEAMIGFDIPPASLIEENGRYYMNALLQRAEKENKNGRIYPKKLLEREVNSYMVLIKAGNALGECDHPEESVVSLKSNPHRIVELWWDNNDLYGKLELLVSKAWKENGTECNYADRTATLIKDYGVNVGISSRGVGSLKSIGGKNIVQDDFELICWDLVHSPSTHNAYLYNNKALNFESKKAEGEVIKESMKRFGRFL